MGEKVTIASERICEGRLVGLRVDTLCLSQGRVTRREVVEHRGSVAIVALDEAKGILLVRQYRRPAERELLEIPAGTLEEGEEPESCACRELEKETGYTAGSLKRFVASTLPPDTLKSISRSIWLKGEIEDGKNHHRSPTFAGKER